MKTVNMRYEFLFASRAQQKSFPTTLFHLILTLELESLFVITLSTKLFFETGCLTANLLSQFSDADLYDGK